MPVPRFSSTYLRLMPISKDQFNNIVEDGEENLPDLSPDTTQGKIYRFLLENRDKAFTLCHEAKASNHCSAVSG